MANPAKARIMEEAGNQRGSQSVGKGGGKRKKKIDAGKLQTLLRDWALQFSSKVVWHVETRRAYDVAGLRNQFGNDEVRLWLQSERRRTVHENQVVFDPAGQCGKDCINLFDGLAMEPKAGHYQPIVDLLYHLCGQDEDLRDWILDWIAYPLQNLGAKMPTAVIMHGDEGSGKNLFWEIVRDIYGEYASVVGQDQLESQFNDWLSRKLFVIGDEVLSRQELRHLKGKLKAIISGKEIQINTKMMPLRTEGNHVNMVFLSNELQPNALDESDRRYCVVWTPPKADLGFYKDVAKCRDAGGTQAFMQHLQQRDLSAFDPYAPPPISQAKRDLQDLSMSSAARFMSEWRGGHIAVAFNSCSVDQAYRLYKRWAMLDGERTIQNKTYFSRNALRNTKGSIDARVCKVGAGSKTTRMWLVAPPPEGAHLGDWAEETIQAFEAKLASFSGDITK